MKPNPHTQKFCLKKKINKKHTRKFVCAFFLVLNQICHCPFWTRNDFIVWRLCVFVLIALFMTSFQCLADEKIKTKDFHYFGRTNIFLLLVDNLGIKPSHQRQKGTYRLPFMDVHECKPFSQKIVKHYLLSISPGQHKWKSTFRFVVTWTEWVNMMIKDFILRIKWINHCRRHQ